MTLSPPIGAYWQSDPESPVWLVRTRTGTVTRHCEADAAQSAEAAVRNAETYRKRKQASFEHQLHDLMEGMWEYYEHDGTIYDEVTTWAKDWVAGREYEASTHLSKRFDI